MGISIILRGVGDMRKSDYDADENLKIDGAMYIEDYDPDEDKKQLKLSMTPSDNLRNSNDDEEYREEDSWELVKKFVIKSKGNYNLRSKVDVTDNYGGGSSNYINVKITKYEHETETETDMWEWNGRNDAWETVQADIDFGELNKDDEIRMYIHGMYNVECHIRNWRLYYDIELSKDMDVWSKE